MQKIIQLIVTLQLLVLVLSFVHCSGQTGVKESNPKKIEVYNTDQHNTKEGRFSDTLIDKATSRQHFLPDTTVGKISLMNSQNVDLCVGDRIMDRLVDDQLPNTAVYSNDGEQKLSVYFHPGGVKKNFLNLK